MVNQFQKTQNTTHRSSFQGKGSQMDPQYWTTSFRSPTLASQCCDVSLTTTKTHHNKLHMRELSSAQRISSNHHTGTTAQIHCEGHASQNKLTGMMPCGLPELTSLRVSIRTEPDCLWTKAGLRGDAGVRAD